MIPIFDDLCSFFALTENTKFHSVLVAIFVAQLFECFCLIFEILVYCSFSESIDQFAQYAGRLFDRTWRQVSEF